MRGPGPRPPPRPVLVVDGYNLICSNEAYAALMELDPAVARRRLVDAVASYAGEEWDATVVFDAGANPSADGAPTDEGGVTVVYSPFGITADSVVETLARGLRDGGRRVRVVTSDAETRHTVSGPMLQVTSARAFVAELEDAAGDVAGSTSGVPRRVTLEDTLTPSVRAILLMMRDGRG